jgi:hypothetical protein
MTGLGKRDQAGQSVKPQGRPAIKSQSPAPNSIQAAGRQKARGRSQGIQKPPSATTPDSRHTTNPLVPCLGRTLLIPKVGKV